MSSLYFKTGGCSIVIGEKYYSGYIDYKPNKIIKFTKILKGHNEFKNLKLIRKIKNYSNYFTIPDEEQFILKTNDKFYTVLKNLFKSEHNKFFYGNLIYNYIDYAGDKDLFDSIIDLKDNNDFTFWKSYKDIINFSKIMMEALNYLHQSKICHLDIKPENIIIDTLKRKFKIIDFGFSSLEPFDDYVNNIRGTIGYYPKKVRDDYINIYLPQITANDFEIDPLPCKTNPKLVYTIDSFCLGRVLYFLKLVYQDHVKKYWFNLEKKNQNKIENIINDLLEKNVYQRITIEDCLKKYF